MISTPNPRAIPPAKEAPSNDDPLLLEFAGDFLVVEGTLVVEGPCAVVVISPGPAEVVSLVGAADVVSLVGTFVVLSSLGTLVVLSLPGAVVLLPGARVVALVALDESPKRNGST